MTISTPTLLGLFALAGVVVVCIAMVLIRLIDARIRIEQERTEAAYHLRDAERLRIEAARYQALLNEQHQHAQRTRVIGQVNHEPR